MQDMTFQALARGLEQTDGLGVRTEVPMDLSTPPEEPDSGAS